MTITLNLVFLNYCICFVLFTLLFVLVSAVTAHGKEPEADKAPKWLYEGETYGLWYSDLATPEQIERYKVYSFIDWGQPASNLKWVEEFQTLV